MNTPTPDPMFRAYAIERHGLTPAQFNENWQAACGWLRQWPLNVNHPSAKAALQMRTQQLSMTTNRELAQAYCFAAHELVMSILPEA